MPTVRVSSNCPGSRAPTHASTLYAGLSHGASHAPPLAGRLPARQLAHPRVLSPCLRVPRLHVYGLVRNTRRVKQIGIDGTIVPPRLGGSGYAKRPNCPMWTGREIH